MIHRFFSSFAYAFKGIRRGFRGQRNIWIMSAAGLLALITSFVLDLGAAAKAVIVLLCSCVLSLEMINTAVERLLDRVAPGRSKKTAEVKDILAGAVLVMSVSAVVIAVLLIAPKLITLIFKSV